MNEGDTLKIILNYTVDGQPIEENQFDEIEFSIGNKRYTLASGVTWDSGISKYTIFISQADSFALGTYMGRNGFVYYQLRLRSGVDVVSTKKKKLFLGDTISDKII